MAQDKKKANEPQNKKSAASQNKDKNAKNNQKKPDAKAAGNKNTTQKKKAKFDLKYLGGLLFAKMMKGGATELREKADEVNRLNVFPVPDGDTGDNMSMTIDSGVRAIENNDSDNLAEVIKVISKGMLLGARGNSGVILSQFFAGVSKGLAKSAKASAKTVGTALELGVEQAYSSVMTPTEGTILTVVRESVEYAVSRLTPESTLNTLFSDLVKEMYASVDRTPEILPVLKEAGVVDSGGAGLFYIMDGINRVLNGEEIVEKADGAKPAAPAAAPSNASFDADSEMTYGYCTELLVQLMNRKCNPDTFDLEALKSFLAGIGDSIVAFRTDSIVKVHVHTLTPEKVLGYLREYGEFITVKIENMSLQHTELEAGAKKEAAPEEKKPQEKKRYGVVAVSNGDGISALFSDLGADEIVRGGQTNNPSTSDFIEAFDKISAENIFVFPNNGNIVMAATQAAEIYTAAKVYVVPSKSIGAGYVALSSMNFESDNCDDLMKDAEDAIGRITSAFISPSIRNADMNGVHVNEGDTIGIVNKEIVVSEPDRLTAARALLDKLLSDSDAFMVTVFRGLDATDTEESELLAYISESYPDIECYSINGGQEIYPFAFVIE